jgi:hypothetical protein
VDDDSVNTMMTTNTATAVMRETSSTSAAAIAAASDGVDDDQAGRRRRLLAMLVAYPSSVSLRSGIASPLQGVCVSCPAGKHSNRMSTRDMVDSMGTTATGHRRLLVETSDVPKLPSDDDDAIAAVTDAGKMSEVKLEKEIAGIKKQQLEAKAQKAKLAAVVAMKKEADQVAELRAQLAKAEAISASAIAQAKEKAKMDALQPPLWYEKAYPHGKWKNTLKALHLLETPSPTACPTHAPTPKPTPHATHLPTHAPTAVPTISMEWGCSECAVGKYQPRPRQVTCHNCPSGRSNSLGTKLSSPVGASGASSERSCKLCPSGWATKAAKGGATCVRCPAGQTSNEKRTLCRHCPGGRYAPHEGSSVCLICSLGQYTDKHRGALGCKGCPRGRGGRAENKNRHDDGAVLPSSMERGCVECACGMYWADSSAARTAVTPLCIACPVGHFNPQRAKSDASACKPAPRGTYAQASADGAGACAARECQKGSFASSPGADACKACPAGMYLPVLLTKLLSTKPGKSGGKGGDLTTAVTTTSCVHCPAGKWSHAGGHRCLSCPAGSANAHIGQSSQDDCEPCASGRYQPAQGAASCAKCGKGKYQVGHRSCPALLLDA